MSEPVFLGLETSTRAASIAVALGDGVPVVRAVPSEQRSTGALFPGLRDLLGEAGRRLRDVNVVCFSAGPGSFTGLRLAATVAQTLHTAIGCAAVPVPTLEAIAFAARERVRTRESGGEPGAKAPVRIAVIRDAGRGQVYGALYAVEGEAIREVEAVGLRDAGRWLGGIETPFVIAGDGVERHAEAVRALPGEVVSGASPGSGVSEASADAGVILRLGRMRYEAGERFGPEQIVPLYVRPPACEEVYEQRRAAARARRGE